ncbi:MAG: carotenoid biosynthesis protein [bacterium]|nr:carotenoid biosynthesis protein [bacterium]
MTDAAPNLISLLMGTVVLRPYVFVFLFAYLAASTLQFGLQRTLLFTIVGYGFVFLSEYSSTRIGIPFGFYYYLDSTRQQELWISNVPFIDSLSFTFLAYASYATALFLYAPLWRTKGDIQVVDSKAIRRSPSVFILSVMLFVLIDLIIDPVALRGSRWFLGQIYGYYEEGVYFGVPLANFLGWGIVGAGLITLHRLIDGVFRHRPQKQPDWGVRWVPMGGLMGPLLYLSVYGFNVFIAFYINEYLLGLVDLFLMMPMLMLSVIQLRRPTNRATAADVATHLRDFPHSPLAFLGRMTELS